MMKALRVRHPSWVSGPAVSRRKQRGFALILALMVLMTISLMIGILEESLARSNSASRAAISKIQADWACFGAAVQASANPPDSLTRFFYYGTEVELTVLHEPPPSLLRILMEDDDSDVAEPDQGEVTIRMFRAKATSPYEDAVALSTWFFLVKETDRPVLWTSWPGVEGR